MNLWHTITVTVSAGNFLVGLVLFFGGLRKKEGGDAKYAWFMRAAGILFLCVALYRSIFVSSYPNRLAWFDTVLNSPFLIRSLAFFAELSFNGMIAAILLKLHRDTARANGGNGLLGRAGAVLPWFSWGCILLAQFFAYAGLIMQYNTPFAIEEALWAVAYLGYLPLVLAGLRQVKQKKIIEKGSKLFLIFIAIWCVGYLLFQCFYALPFIHFADLAQDAGKAIPPDALRLAVTGFIKTRDFDTWGGIGFFIWHTGYFSICSWLTLLFMTAPRKRS